jgi:hypothetical protein
MPFTCARLEARRALDLGEQLRAVGRVADRARGERLDLFHAGGAQEGREDGRRVERHFDSIGPQLPLGAALLAQAGCDPDRLADLVHEAPPGRPRLVAEYDESPRVRAHVDDRNPLHDRR